VEAFGLSATFDFTAKRVDFKGPLKIQRNLKSIADFNQSFENYNLCWHSDL